MQNKAKSQQQYGRLLTSNLQESLEKEFCPPLDSTLVAAFLCDVDVENDAMIDTLRATLSTLAKQADLEAMNQDAFHSDASASNDPSTHGPGFVSSSEGAETEVETDTAFEFDCVGDLSSCSSTSAIASSPTSPITFLSTIFPHVSIIKLQGMLDNASLTGGSMEDVVNEVLTEEFVKELEDRGLDEGEEEDTMPWQVVERKKQQRARKDVPVVSSNGKAKKKKKNATTVALVDIRQKQHHPQQRQQKLTISTTDTGAGKDTWVQITSMATHLSSLLPLHQPSFFLSYFHSPKYSTPAIALRAALGTIAKDAKPIEDTVLFSLLDILYSSPDYHRLSPSTRSLLVSDVDLALAATNGRPDEAQTLCELLRELEIDHETSVLEMGVYHSPISPLSSPSPNSPISLSLSPLMSPLTASLATMNLLSPISPVSPTPPPCEWNLVAPRSPRPSGTHHLAEYIPAYNPKNRKKPPIARSSRQSDVDRWRDLQAKRRDALREASRHWQSRGPKSRGGEVAFYFAEKARELDQQSRKAALEVAREMVEKKRLACNNTDTIDMHGLTTSEAVTIVKEVLSEGWVSSSRPLNIITGRGQHSANRVGVLAPVIKNSLEKEGWLVTKWDGGLHVHGNR